MRKASDKLHALIGPVVQGLGCELVGIEHLSQGRHSLLRIYIDTPQGVTLDDCERVSHQVSGVLDVEDPVSGAYTLEVSSPGLDRPLFTAEHFARYVGQRVKISTHAPIAGRRRFTGVLLGLKDEAVALDVDGAQVLLPLESIDKANLVPEI